MITSFTEWPSADSFQNCVEFTVLRAYKKKKTGEHSDLLIYAQYTEQGCQPCREQPLANLSAQNLLKELISILIQGCTRSDKTWWLSLTFRFPQSVPVQHHRGNLPQKVPRHVLHEHNTLKIPTYFHFKAAHTLASEPSGEEASKQEGRGEQFYPYLLCVHGPFGTQILSQFSSSFIFLVHTAGPTKVLPDHHKPKQLPWGF